MSSQPTHRFYKDWPQQCAPDDYWGQVRRTVGGKPIDPAQIDLIVDHMARLLVLLEGDRLLELCCGNGALSTRWFTRCAGGVGVDFSEPLVEVARRDFTRGGTDVFLLESVVDFAEAEWQGVPFDKALCYGSIQYLTREQVSRTLEGLRHPSFGINRFVIGNLPDRDRESVFRGDRAPFPLDDPDSAIGVWWTREELARVADAAGWSATFEDLPLDSYQHHYRFDAVLVPVGSP